MLHKKFKSVKFGIVLLVIIVLLAAILRLWNLSNYPAGFNADEASLGYNAYSLLHTGKDEYGAPFPLTFKSFGDYKPGLYVYLTMPFVALFGLNETAVRLPSALLGIVTVFLVYLLGRKIFKNEWVGLGASLLLAVSPWHLHFSRGAWETNVATFFTTLGVYLFLCALEERKYLFFSMLAFLASMYTYQSTRLTTPVLVVLLFIFYGKKFLPDYRYYIKFFIILVILTIPFIFQIIGNGGTSRFNGLSIFSDPGPGLRVNQLRGEHPNPGAKTVVLIHNKFIAYGESWLGHYIDHFDPEFLFIKGDPLIRNKVPSVGQFYLIEALFLVVGFLGLVKAPANGKRILIAWILTAPLASSLTYQTPNALRSLAMVVPMTIVAGLGLWLIINWSRKYRLAVIVSILLLFVLSFETVHYLDEYYIHYPKRYPLAWEYGFRQMVSKLTQYQLGYQNVVITDRYDQPYILVLFYEKYPPALYQPQAHLSPRDKFNFGTIRRFDKYQFHAITPQEVKDNPNTLFVGTADEIPSDATVLDRVDFPNGSPAFIFATYKKQYASVDKPIVLNQKL